MGLGMELLKRFEDEGRKRGCVAAFLYTISFQAPGFYKKMDGRSLVGLTAYPTVPAEYS